VWLLLPALEQVLLFVNQADSSTTNMTINIGYLKLPHLDTPGAINVAIERAQNDSLLRDYNFRYNKYALLLCGVQIHRIGKNFKRAHP